MHLVVSVGVSDCSYIIVSSLSSSWLSLFVGSLGFAIAAEGMPGVIAPPAVFSSCKKWGCLAASGISQIFHLASAWSQFFPNLYFLSGFLSQFLLVKQTCCSSQILH